VGERRGQAELPRAAVELAELYGVYPSYVDITGALQVARVEPLLAVLRLLGAKVETLADVPNALAARKRDVWRRVVDPVVVSWDGDPLVIELRLPEAFASETAGFEIQFEDERTAGCSLDLAEAPTIESVVVDGMVFVKKQVTLPWPMPLGYHRLEARLTGSLSSALVIGAPSQAWPGDDGKTWGTFLPLYAARSEADWGAGSLR
jgi:4-alpha-glucanotransferase